MITYLGKSIPNLSQITDSLRQLTKKESLWPTRNYRMHLMTQRKVSRQHCNSWLIFQSAPSVPTAVSSDASPHGLGAMLWQQDSRGHWTPVVCASCSLTDAETCYSQLEWEMLGVVFAITRFRQYVLGRSAQVWTDHKPLISIVNKSFDDVSPRLQRWLVSLMPYQFTLP